MVGFRALMSLGPQDDKHLVPFHTRACLYFANLDQILLQLLQNSRAQFPVRHLAPSKPDSGFYFIAAFQPFARVFHAIFIIVIVRARSKLNFLNSDCYLLLLCLVGLLFGFVLKFSEVNNSANRWVGRSGDLDEIQTFFPGGANCVSNIKYAELFTLLAYDSHLGNTNPLVNAGNGLAPIIRTLAATSKACSYFSPPKEMSRVQSPMSKVISLTLDFGLWTLD